MMDINFSSKWIDGAEGVTRRLVVKAAVTPFPWVDGTSGYEQGVASKKNEEAMSQRTAHFVATRLMIMRHL